LWGKALAHPEKRQKNPRQQTTSPPPSETNSTEKKNDKQRISAYPAGGDNICVTSGVTSRVDVTQYVHSASSHVAIQVDSPSKFGGYFGF
jgi:hypothetical protein